MTGIELIAKEREEQISLHGRTIQSDVLDNGMEQLITAARALLVRDGEEMQMILSYLDNPKTVGIFLPPEWNLNNFKKLLMKPYKERKIIAAALIAADLDRKIYIDNNFINDEESNQLPAEG